MVLLVARGNTAEVRDLVDEAFDEMAFLVEMAIERRARCMGRIGGDHGGDRTARKMVAEGAGIEGTVGDHDLGGQAFDQASVSVISCL